MDSVLTANGRRLALHAAESCLLDHEFSVIEILKEDAQSCSELRWQILPEGVAMAQRRGRPRIYSDNERQYFAELVRQHGARQARRISGDNISVMTLLSIARELGIELKKGRRPTEKKS